MNKIDQIMSWYDGLEENLRFLAFIFFVVLPFAVLYVLSPFLGVGYILFAAYSRVQFMMKTTRAKVKKNERDHA